MILQEESKYLRKSDMLRTSQNHSGVPTQLTGGGGWKEDPHQIKKGQANHAEYFDHSLVFLCSSSMVIQNFLHFHFW